MNRPKKSNLALVGMHGPPEATGLALQKSTQSNPIAGWDVEVANPAAVAAGRRYVEHNLAVAFDKADPNSRVAEFRRAAELLALVRDYKIALDIHDRPDATGEYALLGMQWNAELLGIVALLGIKDIILQPGNNALVNHAPNALTLEFCRGDKEFGGSMVQNNILRLRQCMGEVASGSIPSVNASEFIFYERKTEIHHLQAASLGLLKNEVQILPFAPIPPHVIEQIGLPPADYFAEYWNGVNSSNGEWYGGILQRLTGPPHSK